jgi:hypothetical protein
MYPGDHDQSIGLLLRTVYRLQDGKLVGVATAKYETTGADSVRQFRFEGTRQ